MPGFQNKRPCIKIVFFFLFIQLKPQSRDLSERSARCFCSHCKAAATLEAEGLRQALLKHLKRRRPTSKEWPRTISVALSFSISTQSARLACSPKGWAKAMKYWWPLLGSEWNALCSVPPGKFMCLRFFWRQTAEWVICLCDPGGREVTH